MSQEQPAQPEVPVQQDRPARLEALVHRIHWSTGALVRQDPLAQLVALARQDRLDQQVRLEARVLQAQTAQPEVPVQQDHRFNR